MPGEVGALGPLRLLQVTGTLNPEYGGPPAVLNQLTRSLTDQGHAVAVVTLDPPEASWLADAPGAPIALGPGLGNYGYTRRLNIWLRQNAREFDAVLAHGIWQYQSQAVQVECRRLGVPYFVFVHGALDPWFERRYPGKHAKKSLYWRLFERRTLRHASAALFTCEEERRLARESFTPYGLPEAIVRIGVEEPAGDPHQQEDALLARFPQLSGKRIVLFLGRLHPKKGADLLIDAFSEVCGRDERLHLVIAGPDDDDTEAGLRALAARRGIEARLTWTGMLTGDEKWGAFRIADVFALTSHSENFGIVVAEALSCGVPVLITDKVNIWREVIDNGGGFVGRDTPSGAESLLNRWLDLDDAALAGMRVAARNCFDSTFEAGRALTGFVQVIVGAIEKAGVE